jgi:hypothetical protein
MQFNTVHAPVSLPSYKEMNLILVIAHFVYTFSVCCLDQIQGSSRILLLLIEAIVLMNVLMENLLFQHWITSLNQLPLLGVFQVVISLLSYLSYCFLYSICVSKICVYVFPSKLFLDFLFC